MIVQNAYLIFWGSTNIAFIAMKVSEGSHCCVMTLCPTSGEEGSSVQQEIHPRRLMFSTSPFLITTAAQLPSFMHVLPLASSLLGTIHRAILWYLLLWTASSWERVLILQIIESLRYTLSSKPGLGVMVPTFNESLAHLLDALEKTEKATHTFKYRNVAALGKCNNSEKVTRGIYLPFLQRWTLESWEYNPIMGSHCCYSSLYKPGLIPVLCWRGNVMQATIPWTLIQLLASAYILINSSYHIQK